MEDLVFRSARPDEVGVCVDLCLLANRRELEGFLRGLKRGVNLRDMMMILCGAPDTEFSWRYFTLVEQDGQVIAGLCAVPTDDYPTLMGGLPFRLQHEAGVGYWGLVRLLVRAVGHSLFMPDAPKPVASLYVPVGAVLPAHQRRGVATRTLNHVIRQACRAGYANVCLEVDRPNKAALALYASLGFQPTPPRRLSRKCLMTLVLHPPRRR